MISFLRKGRNFPSLASYMGRRSHFQAAMRSANNACSDILEEDSSNISTNQVNQSFAAKLFQPTLSSSCSVLGPDSDNIILCGRLEISTSHDGVGLDNMQRSTACICHVGYVRARSTGVAGSICLNERRKRG